MGRNTKLGSASRYGARYSSKLKKKVKKIEEIQKTPQVCPQCEKKSLRRISNGIWRCTKCGTEMAGGAYIPRTPVGLAADKVISRGGLNKEELAVEKKPEKKEEPKKKEHKKSTKKKTENKEEPKVEEKEEENKE